MKTQEKPSRILKLPETCHRFGVSRSTLLRWVAEGRIRKIQIGSRGVGFLESEVEALIAAMAAA